MSDMVNSPPHYTVLNPQPIEVIEAWKLDFHLACVLKYISRADYKGNKLEDLKKAAFYLNRKIKLEEEKSERLEQLGTSGLSPDVQP